jgi:Rieske Fe-S protein
LGNSNLERRRDMTELSRRSLIAGICGIATLSLTPLSAEGASVVKKAAGGRLSIRMSDVPKVVGVGASARIGSVKGRPVALLRTGTSTFKAFSLMCPHQGVTVIKQEDGWYCDAHGSKFEVDGALNQGPATTGLPSVPVRVSKGIVTVG